MNENKFEARVKPLLLYVGTIGAVLMAIAYLAAVMVLVFGFQVTSLEQSIVFVAVNAVIGFLILQCLKRQGIDLARNLPENKAILERYNNDKPKTKKHSINHYWITSVIKDVVVKGLTVMSSAVAVIYIVVEGTHDYVLILMALVNLIMWTCFGLLGLVNAYDFYNENHIPYLKEKIKMKEDANVQD